MRKRWYITQDAGVWTLCRSLPARFDLWAETFLPEANPARLMHQIRQDLWRALQKVRGFQPVIQLRPEADMWRVRAGGQAPVFARVHTETVSDVLADPRNRARWIQHAGPWRQR